MEFVPSVILRDPCLMHAHRPKTPSIPLLRDSFVVFVFSRSTFCNKKSHHVKHRALQEDMVLGKSFRPRRR